MEHGHAWPCTSARGVASGLRPGGREGGEVSSRQSKDRRAVDRTSDLLCSPGPAFGGAESGRTNLHGCSRNADPRRDSTSATLRRSQGGGGC